MNDNRVTLPLGVQSPDVLEWSKTLRSQTLFPTRSRSPSPPCQVLAVSDSSLSKQMSVVKGSNMFRPSSRDSSPANEKRRSTGNMAASLSLSKKSNKSTSDLSNIEAEYIKNLQQQIYFLELEATYLYP
ncbi:hypothetical protein ScPMuIL_008113 [Solemya velum]